MSDRLQRKRDWLERCGLHNHEEWPLFGIRKAMTASGHVWVWLTDLPPLKGHRDGVRRLLGEIRRLEHHCEAEGIVGWLQSIRKDNPEMRTWTEMIGAECYAEDATHWYFRKEAKYAALPLTIKELVMTARGGHHAHA
jgi:hypothetical protein